MSHSTTLLALIALGFLGCGGGGSSNERTSETFSPGKEPYFGYQWYLNYTQNDFSSRFGIDASSGIGIKEAWSIGGYGKDVRVAVIDDSFEPTHEDLSGNVIAYYNFDDDTADVSNKTDEASHGHRCAGIIASSVNTKGITGVAPQAKLILIKQFEVDDAKTIAAFEYAKQQGAKVISCSWGTYDVSEAVAQKIREIHDSGITVVFAFGNDAISLDEPFSGNNSNEAAFIVNDESELPSVIGVGASSEFNTRTSYSSYGSALDLLAPGGENIGLATTDESAYLGENPKNETYNYLNENYTFFVGTSASAPVTAGVAALMLAANPSLTPDQIRTLLIQTADKIDAQTYDSSGFSIINGYGKLNAAKAVNAAKSYQ